MARKPSTSSAKTSAPQVEPNTSPSTDKEDLRKPAETAQTADTLPKTMPGEPGVDHPVSGADPSKVEKKTVRTTGEFSLQDPFTGADIPKGKDTEVVVTTFITSRLENGDLEEA